jgi:hypothetical protein
MADRKAYEYAPPEVDYIYYMCLSFSTNAMLGMIERDCKIWDKRDRELIPADWSIETTSDYAGRCSVTFSKDEGGPFTKEEVERVRDAIKAVEETFLIMTRKK